MSRDALREILSGNRQGSGGGIYSVCSAHPLVIEASMRQALADDSVVLIEATSNQVDQFGGYTGMTPADFRDFVLEIADAHGFPRERVILGGDHLGPNRWQKEETAETAMPKAEDLVRAYVLAGYTKIHLDCSMSCVGDPVPLTDQIVAERAARLLVVAEEAAKEAGLTIPVSYVIGTEVPVPVALTRPWVRSRRPRRRPRGRPSRRTRRRSRRWGPTTAGRRWSRSWCSPRSSSTTSR